jgi:hypothetical protein
MVYELFSGPIFPAVLPVDIRARCLVPPPSLMPAAITVIDDEAPSAEETDWPQI